MAWFTFRQNNSGGYYHGPQYVIVEAESSFSANTVAQENDVYFNGINKGIDCHCCGDRWDRVHQGDGTDEPMIYNVKIDPESPVYDNVFGEKLNSDEILVIPKEKSCK